MQEAVPSPATVPPANLAQPTTPLRAEPVPVQAPSPAAEPVSAPVPEVVPSPGAEAAPPSFPSPAAEPLRAPSAEAALSRQEEAGLPPGPLREEGPVPVPGGEAVPAPSAEAPPTSVPSPTAEPVRAPGAEEAAGLTANEAAPSASGTLPTLLVERTDEPILSGQMEVHQFLDELEAEVHQVVEEALANSDHTTDGCPYLKFWFAYYRRKSSRHVEEAIRRYAPEATGATTAQEYVPLIADRARQAVETWLRTGQIRGVPEDLPADVPSVAAGGPGDRMAHSTTGVQYKARAGGARSAQDPLVLRTQMGSGRKLDSGVRARMESAFGVGFGHVRVHTGASAAGLSGRLNARAFTTGEHVAFGAGEYRPGTPIGDALIAHELAHVIQQRGGKKSPSPMQAEAVQPAGSLYAALEEDADTSAAGVVASLWRGATGGASGIARNAMPNLRSGLRLQRCPSTPAAPTHALTVDRIDVIDSPTGAISGFPGIMGNADLNTPGPFNDPTTGEMKNVHQIHFHLDNGDSANLTPARTVDATWSAGGTSDSRSGPDGPRPHEIRRPSTDKIVIADAPGPRSLAASHYPFEMEADFVLTVASSGGTDIARVNYRVELEKQNATDIPNTRNSIAASEKKDLVRNRDL